LSPSLDDRLPEGHVGRFVAEVVDKHPVDVWLPPGLGARKEK
jgi:hypothetical protein